VGVFDFAICVPYLCCVFVFCNLCSTYYVPDLLLVTMLLIITKMCENFFYYYHIGYFFIQIHPVVINNIEIQTKHVSVFQCAVCV